MNYPLFIIGIFFIGAGIGGVIIYMLMKEDMQKQRDYYVNLVLKLRGIVNDQTENTQPKDTTGKAEIVKHMTEEERKRRKDKVRYETEKVMDETFREIVKM